QKPERIPGGWRADRRTGSAVRKRGRVYDRDGEGTVIDRRIRPGYDHTVSAGEVVGCGRHGRHRRVGVGRERCNSPDRGERHRGAAPWDGARRDEHRDRAPSRGRAPDPGASPDRKSTRLNSSHVSISYAVFCLKKKKK